MKIHAQKRGDRNSFFSTAYCGLGLRIGLHLYRVYDDPEIADVNCKKCKEAKRKSDESRKQFFKEIQSMGKNVSKGEIG